MAELMLDGQHHGFLVIGVIDGAHARLSSQTGLAPLTGHDERRFENLAAFEHQPVPARRRIGLHMAGAFWRKNRQARLVSRLGQRHARPAVLGHVAQRLAVILGRDLAAIKMQLVMARPAGLQTVIGAAINDQYVFDWLHVFAQMLAGAHRVEHAHGGVGERRGAPVKFGRDVLGQLHRVHDSHSQPGFVQGQRQGESGEPAAGNHHIAREDRFAHGGQDNNAPAERKRRGAAGRA